MANQDFLVSKAHSTNHSSYHQKYHFIADRLSIPIGQSTRTQMRVVFLRFEAFSTNLF